MRSTYALFVSLAAVLAATVCFSPAVQAQATAQEQAVAFHRARAQSRPDDADAWRLLAGAYVDRAEASGDPADYDHAWETLDRAERLEPGDPRTIRGRAATLLSRHRFPHALALAEHGLQAFPKDGALLAVAGDAALEMGDLDQAERHYRALNQLSQRLSDWARLAHVAELRGNFDLAAGHMAKAIEAGTIRPAPVETLAWCRAVLGEIELKRGKRDEARSQYAQGLEISPGHLLVLEHLAELERLEGNLPAAEAAYRKILTTRWEAGTAVALAAVLDAQGKREEAARLRGEGQRFYERVVGEGNEGYLRQLAALDLAAGRYERAASLLARDLALRPTPEGRALLMKVLTTAAGAGKPVPAFSR